MKKSQKDYLDSHAENSSITCTWIKTTHTVRIFQEETPNGK